MGERGAGAAARRDGLDLGADGGRRRRSAAASAASAIVTAQSYIWAPYRVCSSFGAGAAKRSVIRRSPVARMTRSPSAWAGSSGKSCVARLGRDSPSRPTTCAIG